MYDYLPTEWWGISVCLSSEAQLWRNGQWLFFALSLLGGEKYSLRMQQVTRL